MKTNALDFHHKIGGLKLRLPLTFRVGNRIRNTVRRFVRIDEFNWNGYNTHYRAEYLSGDPYYTTDLGTVDFTVVDGRIYLLSDCKPLHFTTRCVLEALINLPATGSIAEVGTGAGYYLHALRQILGDRVTLRGYDLSPAQLAFFSELFPDFFRSIETRVLDITESAIPDQEKPDVVFASTVLMHILRPDAYRRALSNFIGSGRRFAVLMDNWQSHDYVEDLGELIRTEGRETKLYRYDSGANVALVLALNGEDPGAHFTPVTCRDDLMKYFR